MASEISGDLGGAGPGRGRRLHAAVDTIGEISLQAPQFGLPAIPWDAFGELAASGAIAIVAFTDVIVTARAFSDNARVNTQTAS